MPNNGKRTSNPCTGSIPIPALESDRKFENLAIKSQFLKSWLLEYTTIFDDKRPILQGVISKASQTIKFCFCYKTGFYRKEIRHYGDSFSLASPQVSRESSTLPICKSLRDNSKKPDLGGYNSEDD